MLEGKKVLFLFRKICVDEHILGVPFKDMEQILPMEDKSEFSDLEFAGEEDLVLEFGVIASWH